MADTQTTPLICSSALAVNVEEDKAREIVQSWLDESHNGSNEKNRRKVRFGKAVLVYYPFWKYRYEDGGEDKVIFKPACGTLLTGQQNMQREDTAGYAVPEDLSILPATVNSSVYLPELHGIHRSEELIAIPLWLISYKEGKSVYMVEVDAENGTIYEEWHPVRETVNWKKTATIIFIPMLVISMLAAFFSPWLYILAALLLIFFIYQSNMLSMINLKRKEGKDGA
ncbi:MAG TPA: hypothetical protein O0X39_03860 [Methanocorpusculum sp.]|nr:hypothetical protein [Methanocorpusculum sp.]